MENYSDEEIRVLIDEDRDAFIAEIQRHPSFADNLHPRHTECQHLFRLAHGIDKESRERDRKQAIPIISLPNQERIKAIERTLDFQDRTRPGHRLAHRVWLSLHE